MKTSIVSSLLASVASLATASVIPRQHGFVPANSCCFTLHDASTGGAVREDRTYGALELGGGNADGWFCIDLSGDAGILRDEAKNACFVAPDNEVKCHDQLPGPQTWALVGGGRDGAKKVTYDGEDTFKACDEGGYQSVWSADKGGCREFKVEARGFQGAC